MTHGQRSLTEKIVRRKIEPEEEREVQTQNPIHLRQLVMISSLEVKRKKIKRRKKAKVVCKIKCPT